MWLPEAHLRVIDEAKQPVMNEFTTKQFYLSLAPSASSNNLSTLGLKRLFVYSIIVSMLGKHVKLNDSEALKDDLLSPYLSTTTSSRYTA